MPTAYEIAKDAGLTGNPEHKSFRRSVEYCFSDYRFRKIKNPGEEQRVKDALEIWKLTYFKMP